MYLVKIDKSMKNKDYLCQQYNFQAQVRVEVGLIKFREKFRSGLVMGLKKGKRTTASV